MNKSDILMVYDYNYWATARVLNAAAKLTLDQFTAPGGLSHGNVRAYLDSLSDDVLNRPVHYKTTMV